MIIRPGRAPAAVVDAERMRRHLALAVLPNVRLATEEGVWVLLMPGKPFAAEGTDLEAGLKDFVDALREYADAWEEHVHTAPNHQGHWALVQLVRLSSDEQLVSGLAVGRGTRHGGPN